MSEMLYADCCERAIALHVYTKGTGMLALCGHHSGKNRAKMVSEGWTRHDASVPVATVMNEVENLWKDDQWQF